MTHFLSPAIIKAPNLLLLLWRLNENRLLEVFIVLIPLKRTIAVFIHDRTYSRALIQRLQERLPVRLCLIYILLLLLLWVKHHLLLILYSDCATRSLQMMMEEVVPGATGGFHERSRLLLLGRELLSILLLLLLNLLGWHWLRYVTLIPGPPLLLLRRLVVMMLHFTSSHVELLLLILRINLVIQPILNMVVTLIIIGLRRHIVGLSDKRLARGVIC